MNNIETMKLALEALEVANSCIDGYYIPKGKTHLPEVESAITALRQAIEQAQQAEPVGQLCEETYGRGQVMWFKKPADGSYVYTSPPPRQPDQETDGVALTNIPHPKGAPATDDLNVDALEVVELELPDEDEAVAWADGGVVNWIAGKQFKHASYLYATPPPRQPEQPKVRTGNCLRVGVCASEGHKIAPPLQSLTDEQIKAALVSVDPETKRLPPSFRDFARAIEAAHGIKGEA